MSDLPLPRDADDLPMPVSTSMPFSPREPDAFDRSEYVAILVTDDRSREECTIFPADVSEADVVTTWITATEGSFVSLAQVR